MTDAGRMRVLLATDGEDSAFQAERLLADIANRSAIEVLVACVSTFDMTLRLREDLYRGYDSPEAGLPYAERVAEAAGARLETAGLEARWCALNGPTAAALTNLASRESFGLVTLGAGHAGHIRGREFPVLGHTGRLVLNESPCSVLVVHRWRPDRERRHVLVATDGSAGAEHAIRVFGSFADPARCRVLAASVTWMRRPGASPQLPQTLRRRAEASVDAAASILEERGFACKSEVVEGLSERALLDPERALLELAEREGSCLVVAGSPGFGRLGRLTVGPVSDALAWHADAAFIGREAPQAGAG